MAWKGGVGMARMRIELDPEVAEKLKEALERAEPVEKSRKEKPTE